MASHWLGISNAIAAGGMLAASVGLLWQGWSLGIGRLGAGAVLGAVCIYGFRRLLGDSEAVVLGRLTGADAGNIPEGLAIRLVLVPRGPTVRAAAGWSVFSSLPQPLIAPPSFLFVPLDARAATGDVRRVEQ